MIRSAVISAMAGIKSVLDGTAGRDDLEETFVYLVEAFEPDRPIDHDWRCRKNNAFDKFETILQAATRDATLDSGECFIVKASGETDLPIVRIVRDLEAARHAVLSLMYSDPADAEDTEELFDDFDERMLNDEHWDIAFEIGGISVERVCLDATDNAPSADAVDALKEAGLWLHSLTQAIAPKTPEMESMLSRVDAAIAAGETKEATAIAAWNSRAKPADHSVPVATYFLSSSLNSRPVLRAIRGAPALAADREHILFAAPQPPQNATDHTVDANKKVDAEHSSMMFEAVKNAGYQLANCAFNLAQRPGEKLSLANCKTLDTCRNDWDAAIHALKDAQSVRDEELEALRELRRCVESQITKGNSTLAIEACIERMRALRPAPPQKPDKEKL